MAANVRANGKTGVNKRGKERTVKRKKRMQRQKRAERKAREFRELPDMVFTIGGEHVVADFKTAEDTPPVIVTNTDALIIHNPVPKIAPIKLF